MKKLGIVLLLLPTICFAQKKKHWYNNYWVSANVSLLHSIAKRGTGLSIDAGRNLKPNIKAGVGYTFLQFDIITKVDVLNLYLEKSINSKNNQLYFFVKPGIAIPKKAKAIAETYSSFEYDNKKFGLNMQLGAGIRWKVNRHSFFLNGGYNITKYSFTTKQDILPVNPYNPFFEDPIFHTYKIYHSNILVNLGFTL
jgi:Outer membrane protein beta-barrel domain